ncbi:hypothetical protein D9C73_028572 [Collichthys lucidus]|uniref:Uncharacterized protein n=1 Tax=Collichthys lucidus TaxID=240159 RepID=A0A4U5TW59_COLLU|nr:hypothetical protein D9C73_028572 [Collichthys lucidus]
MFVYMFLTHCLHVFCVRCLSAVEAELVKLREEHSHAQLLKQEVVRDTAASQEQLKELSVHVEEKKKHLQTVEQELSVSSQQQQQRREQLTEIDRLIQHRQAVCAGLGDVKAAVCQVEDRGRRLREQELQLNQLKEELCQREKQLIREEEGLIQRREGLQQKEEGPVQTEEELHNKQELHVKDDEEEESFYLSTGLRSASTEEERWEAELQRERLRQQEDRLKVSQNTESEIRVRARLRCSLWTQQETLMERRLEAEDSLLGLKHQVDQLDSLLTHTHTVTGNSPVNMFL